MTSILLSFPHLSPLYHQTRMQEHLSEQLMNLTQWTERGMANVSQWKLIWGTKELVKMLAAHKTLFFEAWGSLHMACLYAISKARLMKSVCGDEDSFIMYKS